MTPSMTSRERVLAALHRQPVDRTPLCNPTSVATVELMDLVDAPFPDANRKPELMARLAATGYTELGFDTIMPVFTIIQESSALGCKIQWEQKDNWPTVRMSEPVWSQPEDIRVPGDIFEHPDMTCVTDAIRILRREFGDEMFFIMTGLVDLLLFENTTREKLLSTIGDGSYFGDSGLLFGDGKRTATARCQTNCVIYRCANADMHALLRDFPQVMERFVEVAQRRQQKTDAAALHTASLSTFAERRSDPPSTSSVGARRHSLGGPSGSRTFTAMSTAVATAGV